MRRGTNLPAMGVFNQSVILDAIRRSEGGLSRVELAELTGLSQQTISNVTRRLLDDGMVREAGKTINGRGKPRVTLRLVPRSRVAVGVHLDPAVVTYVMLDLTGSVIAHSQSRDVDLARPAKALASIASDVAELVRGSGVSQAAVLGLGVATPGPIDARRGLMVHPPLLEQWHEVPIRDDLARRMGMPVVLDKDVNAAVVAELWTTNSVTANLAFFYFGSGIGIGLAVGGDVVRGATGNAGEGGTIIVASEDLPSTRRSNQLGHVVSPRYLIEQARERGVLPPSSAEHAATATAAALGQLVALADARDPEATAITDRAAALIGASLVTVVNLLDVDEIVFGGPYWDAAAPHMRPVIEDIVTTSAVRATRTPVEFRSAAAADDVAAVGAACLILDATLAPRPASLLIED